MKRILNIKWMHSLLLSVFLMGFSSCIDYEDFNKNPVVATTIDPNSQLSYIQLCMGGDWLMEQPFAYYYSGFVQQLQGDWSATHFGGEYLIDDAQFQQPWERIYTCHLKNLADILWRTEEDVEQKNINAVAQILKCYFFLILTDMYGDIPYFEAEQGYITGNVTPKFDEQELIYKDMHKELLEAEEQLDENADKLTGDIIYSGDLKKWRKFANTLNFRIAMRLVKVAPELAEEWVTTICNIESGLLGVGDDALIHYMDLLDWDETEFRRNGLAQLWRSRENAPMCYFCTTMWDKLKTTNDPRLLILGRCYAEDSTDPFLRTDLTDFIMEKAPKQLESIEAVKPGFYWWDNWPAGFMDGDTYYGKECRPQLNKGFIKGDSPAIFMSYAETELLLAEAKLRWPAINDSKTVETHYSNGVKAAMGLLKNFDLGEEVSNTEMASYLSRNPLPSDKDGQLQFINEQLWILHLINPSEAYSNWRRSGYPVLKPSTEYGAAVKDSRTIPRRLKYPLFEQTYNPTGYYEAVGRMGGEDNWNCRIWWDKE